MTPETERALLATLRRIERNTLLIEAQEIDIMMTQAELATALDGLSTGLSDVATQLAKAQQEIITAVTIAGNTTPEVDAAVGKLQTAVDGLKALAQTLDDMNPDVPPAP